MNIYVVSFVLPDVLLLSIPCLALFFLSNVQSGEHFGGIQVLL